MKYVSIVFVVLSIAALAFFVHKVLWLVRNKKLQRQLMEAAEKSLRSSEDAVLPGWNTSCRDCWKHLNSDGAKDAEALAKNFDAHVHRTLTWVERSTRSITTRLLQSLDGPVDPPTFTVLETPDAEGKVVRADVTLDPEPIGLYLADGLFQVSFLPVTAEVVPRTHTQVHDCPPVPATGAAASHPCTAILFSPPSSGV